LNGGLHGLAVFIGVAAIVTLTPGPATAMVIRSTLRGGRRAALLTTFGNACGVLFWGAASAVGISALIAASEVAFLTLKIGGAVVLVSLGIQSFLRSRRGVEPEAAAAPDPTRHAFRDGLVTSFANPKLAVFFVALFPQFVTRGHSPLIRGLEMSALIVALDLVWFSALAVFVTRVRRALEAGRWGHRLERLTGTMMIGLGLRLALESR
jgi:threonine/homoserine/homoserine lactone efflux protein